MTHHAVSEVCCHSGLVRSQQVDASGALRIDAAAALVGEALQALLALHGAQTPDKASPTAKSLSMERVDAALLPVDALATCWLSASADQVSARLCGPGGTAWQARIALTHALPDGLPPAPDAALPPMRLLRVMRQQHCDQAGHVNVQWFMDMAAEAVEVIQPGARITQTRINFKKELFKGDVVSVHAGVHRIDEQGMHVVHGIVQQPSGQLACVVETCVTGVDASAASVGSWPALPLARAPALPHASLQPDAAAISSSLSVVDAWDTDGTGCLSPRALVNLCSTGARQYLARIGLTGARFLAEQISVAAVDYLIDIDAAPALGSNLTLRSAFLSGSAKSIRFAHHLLDSDDGRVYARIEIVGVMLDLKTHRSMEIPQDVKQRLGLATN